MSPKSNGKCPYKRKTGEHLTHRNTGEKLCEDENRDWRGAITSQGYLEPPETQSTVLGGGGYKAPPRFWFCHWLPVARKVSEPLPVGFHSPLPAAPGETVG